MESYHKEQPSYLLDKEVENFRRLFGAVVVLAHPVVIRKESITYIINLPFDGIEEFLGVLYGKKNSFQ